MTYFFFYGIFKQTGCRHAAIFHGCKQLGPAKAPGFVLLRHTGPAAMVPGKTYEHEDATAKGTVTGVPDERLDELLEFLDRAESNGRSYIRVKIEAELEDGKVVEAYAYLWMDFYNLAQGGEILSDGNWSGFRGFRHDRI